MPSEKIYTFDGSICNLTDLREEKIQPTDLQLIRDLGLKDWSRQPFDEESLVKYGRWVVSENRDIILMPLGGGGSEIPEMYSFIYHGHAIKIECGGGGAPAETSVRREDGSYATKVWVSRIWVPTCLSSSLESVLSKSAEALAVLDFRGNAESRSEVSIIVNLASLKSNAKFVADHEFLVDVYPDLGAMRSPDQATYEQYFSSDAYARRASAADTDTEPRYLRALKAAGNTLLQQLRPIFAILGRTLDLLGYILVFCMIASIVASIWITVSNS